MAKKGTASKPQKEEHPTTHICRECSHAYNWHNKSLNDAIKICYCQHYQEGRHCKFLSDKACEHFEKRKG